MATQSGPSVTPETVTATATPIAGAAAQAHDNDHAARLANAQGIIRRNVLWALGAGVVPVPVMDVAAVMGVEMKLLRELSNLYGVSFTEGLAKKIAYSLLSSVGLVGIGSLIGGSLAKLIPVFGTTLGMVSVPVLVGAFTHGLGAALVMHFETGGTLLNFDAVAMRSYFKQEFEKAKHTVTQMQSEANKSSARA